jgi:hypothetical protein
MAAIDPLTAAGVLLATAATDAVYVMFTSAVVARRRVPATTWSSVWYLLRKLDLCRLRRDRFMAGRVCIDHLPAPATRRSADRRRTRVANRRLHDLVRMPSSTP